jgi:hypothetical protein
MGSVLREPAGGGGGEDRRQDGGADTGAIVMARPFTVEGTHYHAGLPCGPAAVWQDAPGIVVCLDCGMTGPLPTAENKPPAKPVPLAKIETFGSVAREAALKHFEMSLEEIERILGKSSPDKGLRDDLALALWHYARGKANQDGTLPERPSDLPRYVESLGETARRLHDMLAKGHYAEYAAANTAVIMLEAAGVDVGRLLEQLNVILSAIDVDKSKGGRPPDVEYKVLMDRVVDIFQLATGRRATVTADRVIGKFSGKFFRVAELTDAAAASATQQSPRTNGALGELLQDLLKPRTF